jgi:hypothetical protein
MFFQIELRFFKKKIYIDFLEILHKNSLFWSVIWKYGLYLHFLKTPSEIIGYHFKIHEKFKKLTLFLMCCFILYISAIWIFSSIKCKTVTIYVSNLQVSFIVKRHACVSDLCNEWFSMLMIYSHRQRNENLAKEGQKGQVWNLVTPKTNPMTLDFLYNFLTLLLSRN